MSTTVQMFGIRIFKKKEINAFIQQEQIKLIRNDRKYIYNVTKYLFSL